MSVAILVNRDTRVIVQGMTGRQGSFHTRLMMEYGTKVVAGVSPGKGGTRWEGIPVFDTVAEALAYHAAEASIIFVPPVAAAESICEAVEGGLKVVVCITDGIPQHEMLMVKRRLRDSQTVLIGPNCPGVITPGECKLGIMPAHVYRKGPVGIVSRSGSLSYEVALILTTAGLGQSTVVGVGGDPVKGADFAALLPLLEEDPETEVVVLIGEIGGTDEERAAEVIARGYRKPVVALVVGRSAPPGKKMGHAGAIVARGRGGYLSKVQALRAAGAAVAETPWDVPALVRRALAGRLPHQEQRASL